MDINLNNIGLKGGTLDVGIGDIGAGMVDAARAARPSANLEITAGASGLTAAEPVADVPDSALARDDALGRLVTAAFSLQPPAMPQFADV